MIHLKPETERLLEEEVRKGRFQSADEIITKAICALREQARTEPAEDTERRRQAVQDALEFAEKHHFTLGEGVRIKDLLHESHKY